MDLTPKKSPDDLRAEGWRIMDDDGFLGFVGPVWERWTGNGPTVGFIAEPKHRNRAGVVQGGMLATLADRTLGLTARQNEPGRSQATVHLDINYLDSAQIGEFVTARATVLRQTTTLAFLSGTIEAEGRIIASMSGIWRIRPGVKVTSR
jgi:uncharacterized protein (TIGR00369 family)